MAGIDTRSCLVLAARLLLAGVFISAALPKIKDPLSFAVTIDRYRIINGDWSMVAATVLPWLELTIAIGLLTPWLRRASAAIMAGLLVLFISLHVSAWLRGIDLNCGCFGASADSPDYVWLILRNLALLITALFIIRFAAGNKQAPQHTR